MRYSIAALALAATSVYAQSLSQLPSCALSCLVNAVPATGCSAVDFPCVCKASAILTPIVTPCAEAACDAADFAALPADLEAFCAEAGVTITVTPPTAATTSSSAAGTTTSAAAITTAAVSTVASSSAASSSAKPSSTVSGAASGTGAVPTSTPSFISGASSNDLKIGAAALAAVAALIL